MTDHHCATRPGRQPSRVAASVAEIGRRRTEKRSGYLDGGRRIGDLVDARLVPVFFSYVLSFAYIAIYWNNHHHLMSTADHVSGAIMWANMHLLFWLSLIPFSTSWLGASHGAAAPAALYGLILLMAAIAYFALSRMIVREGGAGGVLARAVGRGQRSRPTRAGQHEQAWSVCGSQPSSTYSSFAASYPMSRRSASPIGLIPSGYCARNASSPLTGS